MSTTTSPIILSPHHKNVTLTGTIHAYGSVGVYENNVHSYYDAIYGAVGAAPGPRFTILNLGDIDSAGNDSGLGGGIVLGSAGTITNEGTITGLRAIDVFGTIKGTDILNTGTLVARHQFAPQNGCYGVYLQARGFVTNAGLLTGGEAGIDLHSGGVVVNTGRIEDTYSGILAAGPATIANGGSITGFVAGVNLRGGSFSNSATGVITEIYGKYENDPFLYAGVRMESGAIMNNGTITGTNGIKFDGQGNETTVKNTGRITAWGTADSRRPPTDGFLSYGVAIFGNEAGTVNNSGTIQATHAGIVLYASPLYKRFQNADASIVNTGLIESSNGYGMYLVGDGITVHNSGTIAGYGNGILARAISTFASEINNSGLVIAPALPQIRTSYENETNTIYSAGILVTGAGTIHNTASGTVTAIRGTGIELNSVRTNIYTHLTTVLHGTIINAGLVVAQYGVEFAGEGYVSNIGTILGTAIGVKASGSLVSVYNYGLITSSSIAVSLATGGYLYNAGTILGGIEAAGAITNDGLIYSTAAVPILITGSLTGAGAIDLQATANINGGVGPGQTIDFTGTAETLALGRPTAFAGTIANFKPGDIVDLTGIPFAQIKSEHFANGVLTLTGTTATYRYTIAGNFSNETFSLFADGTGIGITLSSASMKIMSPVASRSATRPNFATNLATTLKPDNLPLPTTAIHGLRILLTPPSTFLPAVTLHPM